MLSNKLFFASRGRACCALLAANGQLTTHHRVPRLGFVVTRENCRSMCDAKAECTGYEWFTKPGFINT